MTLGDGPWKPQPGDTPWRRLVRGWQLYHLGDPRLAFMWAPPPPGEVVALDTETTGLDRHRDEIVAIGAVRIAGNRILTSQKLELLVRPGKRALSRDAIRVHRLRTQDLAQGLDIDDALDRLLHFVGSRPLVGYYLEFDLAMIDRALFPRTGLKLPQRRIEVSAMYYAWKQKQRLPHERDTPLDLRFATLMADLALPQREAHDAVNDAVMAAMAYVKLRALGVEA